MEGAGWRLELSVAWGGSPQSPHPPELVVVVVVLQLGWGGPPHLTPAITDPGSIQLGG